MASVGVEPEASPDYRTPVTHVPRRAISVIAGVAAVTVAIDQLTKWWALEALTDPTRAIDLVWTLRLRVLFNTGTAFSLTSDSGPFVTVIAAVVIVLLLRSGRHQHHRGILASYGLVLGGTVGNLLDRIFRDGDGLFGGPVIDFVDLQWFPVFNVADAALVVGIILLVLLGSFTDAFVDHGAGRDRAGASGADGDGSR